MKKPLAIMAIVSVFAVALAVVFIRQNDGTIAKTAGLPSSPKRIVSLSPNLTEIVFAMGLGDRVVAVSNNCDWPAEAKTKPKVGTFWQPNTEAIIAVRPDLVVCESFDQQRAVAQTLRRTGSNVLMLRVESIEELLSAIEQIGKAAGCTTAAEKLVADIKQQLDQIRSVCSSAKRVKILWVVQPEPLRLAGVNTFINEIVELSGGRSAIKPTFEQYPSIATEEIIGCGAEVIIQSAMGTGDIQRQQAAAEKFWSRFANLPAVRNKRIYVINADTVLRLGPRLPQGAQAVARCLHPELFAQPQDKNQKPEHTDG